MTQNIKISIIVPVYNNSQYLARCLRSLLSQNFEFNSYEIILINDGSKDSTSDILDIFKEDLILLGELFS